MLAQAMSEWGTAGISLAGVVLAGCISGAFALRQARENDRLQVDMARLNSDLQVEVQARTAMLERQQHAEEVLKRYREPLAAAAFDLQARLYNILRMDFFTRFADDPDRAETAYQTTLFRLAQYFGWTEILRRDIQFLSFPEAEETRAVVALQSRIAKRFGTSDTDRVLMIWTDEQRALGEGMIVDEHDTVLCMGFARFHEEYAKRFGPWCERLRAELSTEPGHQRLKDVQHLLCDLVETLDQNRVRYTEDLERA